MTMGSLIRWAWRVKGALVLTFSILLAATVVAGIAVSWNLPSVTSLKDFRPPTSTEVFSDDYVKIGEFFNERRIYVPLHQVPPLLVKAFIAAEDADFFKHKGVSISGILRAMVRNMLAGGMKQGGSTITQQLAKGLLLTREKKLLRKIREAILATKMEKFLTKEEILELYLNYVYLGHGAYGVEAAAQVYFGKDAVDLSLPEVAVLAALPKAPGRDNPFTDPERSKDRRNYVLRRMLDESYITSEQERTGRESELTIVKETNLNLKYAPYFVEHVRRHLIEKYGEEVVYQGGLQVYTTLRVKDALGSQKALSEGIEELDRRQGYRGPISNVPEKERAAFAEKLKTEQPKPPLTMEESYRALVTDVKDKEGWVFIDVGYTKGVIPFETMTWARTPNPDRFWENDLITKPSKALKAGDVIWVRMHRPGADLKNPIPKKTLVFMLFQEPQVQGALLSLDPKTGAVRAMVGGYNFTKSELNRAMQSKRQPGSAFKPIIYTTALDNGYTAASIIVDSPIVYDDPTHDSKWKPKNFEGDFQGNTIFRDSLIKSRNVPTIKILQQIGVETAMTYAQRMGITSELSKDFSMALGSSSLTPIELISAYATFAAGGRRVTPVFIKKVLDRDGNLLERHIWEDLDLADQATATENQWQAKVLARQAMAVGKDPKAKLPDGYALSPQTAFLMTNLLKEVIHSGTGAKAAGINRPAAGKTGTTNDNFDAWFIGFTPDLVAGVWVGFDKPTSLGVKEMGGALASPIWLSYMLQALKGTPPTDFTVPEGVIFAQIDPKNGKVATSKTKGAVFEAFREGTEPTETSEAAEQKKSQQNFFLNE
jgi:penicillin-binding protein 1A